MCDLHKINVMHLVPSLEIGGMEKGIIYLANKMDKKRFNISICCLERVGALVDQIEDKGIEIINLKQKSGVRLSLPIKLRALFKEKNIDIVHTHNFYSGLYGVIGARLAHVPVVIHGEHGLFEKSLKRNILGKMLSHWIDYIVSMSEGLKKEIANNWNLPESKIFPISNGVAPEILEKKKSDVCRSDYNIGENDFVIGTVGRIVPVKNHLALIMAFIQVRKVVPDCKLIIVGDGELKSSLEKLVEEKNISDDVIFTGEINNASDIMRLMDVFVLLSFSEGISNTIMEAMGVGIPIVASNVGGNCELIKDGVTGFLVDHHDVEAIKNKLIAIRQDHIDADALIKRARVYIQENRSLEKTIQKNESLYLKAIKEKCFNGDRNKNNEHNVKESKNKIRVMHIIPSLEVGGMENGVVNIANNINKDIFSISICCVERMGLMADRLEKHIEVICLNQKPGKSLLLAFKIRALLCSKKIDIVHTHNNYCGLYGIFGAAMARTKVIFHGEHGVNISRNILQFIATCLIGRRADLTINVSQDISRLLIEKNFFPKTKVISITNGVDTSKFTKKEKLNSKQHLQIDVMNAKVLGNVGRLCEFKNHQLLINMMEILVKENNNLVLVIVGDGPLRDSLISSANDLILKKRIIFMGLKDNVEDIYRLFDVFILPSNPGEGTSNVLLEAMASGIPVIASDTPGNNLIVSHGKNGLLFKPNDVYDLRDKVQCLLTDDNLREKITAGAIKSVEANHSLKVMVSKYEEQYLSHFQSKRSS